MTVSMSVPVLPNRVQAHLVGEHPTMVALRALVLQLAPGDMPVVVEGPTGAGKELVVGLLHSLGGRRGRLVPVNVATLDNQLAESELFGAEKGAYTGAATRRDGLIHAAVEGTLFLDEAGDLAMPLQTKLLRVLEDGRVRRVGAKDEEFVPFRLVTCLQRSPAELARRGRWREDFMFRVSGVVIRVPALAERASDVPLLAAHFLERSQRPPLPAELNAFLTHQPWPGNVRQLKRVIERAAALAGPVEIDLPHLTRALKIDSVADGDERLETLGLADYERARYLAVLAAARTRAEAARTLGLSERTFYRRLQRLGLSGKEGD